MNRVTRRLLMLSALLAGLLALPAIPAGAGGALITVDSTADPGDGNCGTNGCTLREAITAANANSDTTTVNFNLSGATPHVIQPTSALPPLTEQIHIDGTSEPDYSGVPVVVVDGDNAGDTDGFVFNTTGSSIKGLVISGWDAVGGGGRAGIYLLNGNSNTVQNNYIGTDPAGALPDRNHWGVKVETPNNLIGGSLATGNVISGNGANVAIHFAAATNNTVQGNLVGLTADGSASLQSLSGVQLHMADSNLIGGPKPQDRNVISIANAGSGGNVLIGYASGTEVYGNYIGTNPAGTNDPTPHPDQPSPVGISLYGGSDGNFIGGNSPGEGNLISGNRVGMELGQSFDTGSEGNEVLGNLIGTDKTGKNSLPNYQSGVVAYNSGNKIGGPGAGGNVIAFNGDDGVVVPEIVGAERNSIRGNSIHSNFDLGIDLDPAGVTPNDAGDTDTGANQRQNFPVISKVVPTTGGIAVKGRLSSLPSTTFKLDFYSSKAVDPSGFGEGATYLGSGNVMTPGSGMKKFSLKLSKTVKPGHFVTATATDPNDNTSEFSQARRMCTDLGTGGADILEGTSKADVLCGKGGKDTFKGMGGNDVLLGGGGNDDLLGGDGKDRLFGQKGNDDLNGGPGKDNCVQGPGSGSETSC